MLQVLPFLCLILPGGFGYFFGAMMSALLISSRS